MLLIWQNVAKAGVVNQLPIRTTTVNKPTVKLIRPLIYLTLVVASYGSTCINSVRKTQRPRAGCLSPRYQGLVRKGRIYRKVANLNIRIEQA